VSDSEVCKRETFSIDEVAAVLGLHRMSVRSAIDRGEIPAIRIGHRWLVPRSAVDELLGVARGDGSVAESRR